MYRLQLVSSQHRAASAGVYLAHFFQLCVTRTVYAIYTDDVLVFGVIAAKPLVIYHLQGAALCEHPAELPIVRMHGGLLMRLPADGHHFEQVVAVNQIARIKFVVEMDVGRKR